MPFPPEVKLEAMVACGRCCSLCHKFCGNNMEAHHIMQEADGGACTFENAIPLCFDCHAEVGQYSTRHPKGIKFTEEELRRHRDNWYKKISGEVSIQTIEVDDIKENEYPASIKIVIDGIVRKFSGKIIDVQHGVKHTSVISRAVGNLTFQIHKNEFAIKISFGDRFFLSKDVWKVIAINDTEKDSIIVFCEKELLLPNDDVTRCIASKHLLAEEDC